LSELRQWQRRQKKREEEEEEVEKRNGSVDRKVE
jgi:hypothetical protein